MKRRAPSLGLLSVPSHEDMAEERRKTRRDLYRSERIYHRGRHIYLCERLPWDQVRREEKTAHRVVAGIMS